jgi:Family of unknown function (DUF6151)
MPTNIAIRCACGKLRGIVHGVERGEGNRGMCYCDDCQSFAHFLGRADRILDPRGGTPIFQISAARVELTHGSEHLASMRLTPKGLLRWYAGCCRTPIGNTFSAGMPAVGIIEPCLEPEASGASLDDVLGPVRFHVFTRFARRPQPGGSASSSSPIESSRWATTRAVLRMLGVVVRARLGGAGRRSPFFDPATGKPRVKPSVLSPDELRVVETARDAA